MIQLKVTSQTSNTNFIYINQTTQRKYCLIESRNYVITSIETIIPIQTIEITKSKKKSKEHIVQLQINNQLPDQTIQLNNEISIQLGFPKIVSIRLYSGQIQIAKEIRVIPCLHPLMKLSKQISFFNNYKKFNQFNDKIIQIGDILSLNENYLFEEPQLVYDSIGYYSFRIVDIIEMKENQSQSNTTNVNKQKVYYKINEKTQFKLHSTQSFNQTITKKIPTSSFISNHSNAIELYN